MEDIIALTIQIIQIEVLAKSSRREVHVGKRVEHKRKTSPLEEEIRVEYAKEK